MGKLYDIHRFSIRNGPGIRTVVYLQGCPLRCQWCDVPEAQRRQPQLSFRPEACIGCGYCFAHCQHKAHRHRGDNHELQRDNCVVCGVCANGCGSGALRMIGREASVEEVLAEVNRDRAFFAHNGGGLTISGGEPLMQPTFTRELLRAAREQGIHTCLETCGFGEAELLAELQPLVDLFLYDIKELDNARHIEYTGVSNRSILTNLRSLVEAGAAVRLRLPIVPGINDTAEHRKAVAELWSSLPGLLGADLIPYQAVTDEPANHLDRYMNTRIAVRPPTPEDVEGWRAAWRQAGVPVNAAPALQVEDS